MTEKEQRDTILSLRCISTADLQAILEYLGSRPYTEVNGLIVAIQRTQTVEHLLKEAKLSIEKQATE